MPADTGAPFGRVLADWALWQTPRVIGHSYNATDARVFDDVLNNFSPGSLMSQLAAVTIVPYPEPALITMAIHDQYPLDNSEPVHARLFCVQYRDLAPRAVTYLSMYAEFASRRPSPHDRQRIPVRLPATDPAGIAAQLDPLAVRVAALLLTTDRVCVVGADHLELRDRLKFIDMVTTLLPYGMRARLPASTWVSSTMDDHNLRLFFSTASRWRETRQVRWAATDTSPTADNDADEYLSLLNSGALDLAKLARYTEPIDFTREKIGQMLGRIMISQDQRLRDPRQPSGAEDLSLRELLRSCGEGLDGKADLAMDVERLQRYLDQPRTAEQRRRYAEYIRQFRLFRPSAHTAHRLGQFYDALLRVAFGTRIDYPDYCQIEAACADIGGQPPNALLLSAVLRAELEPPVKLLALAALGDEDFKQAVRDGGINADAVVMAAANRDLQPRHTSAIIEIIVRNLLDRPGTRDQGPLKAALARHRYLAPILQHQFPDDPDRQFEMLTQVLQVAYRNQVKRQDVTDLFGNTPTLAMLAAVTRLVSSRDLSVVAREFTTLSINTAKFSTAVAKELNDRLATLRHKPGPRRPW